MQTRSQSSTVGLQVHQRWSWVFSLSLQDSHSDQLIKLFDQSLSTVTPHRDDEVNHRARPLPLCLSDNEKNLPVLTVISNEETSHAHVRPLLVF